MNDHLRHVATAAIEHPQTAHGWATAYAEDSVAARWRYRDHLQRVARGHHAFIRSVRAAWEYDGQDMALVRQSAIQLVLAIQANPHQSAEQFWARYGPGAVPDVDLLNTLLRGFRLRVGQVSALQREQQYAFVVLLGMLAEMQRPPLPPFDDATTALAPMLNGTAWRSLRERNESAFQRLRHGYTLLAARNGVSASFALTTSLNLARQQT